jgi:hypothetical protein
MKKLARNKLVLDRDTIQILTGELTQVVGGRPPCTEKVSGCTREPSGAASCPPC